MHDNLVFQFHLLRQLREITSYSQELRVLDYGTGPDGLSAIPLTTLRRGASVVGFDPLLQSGKSRYEIDLTDQEPLGEKFQLVVCHFSIHHMEQPPHLVVANLCKYNPNWIAIAEYDYAHKPLEEFTSTFVSQAEKNELERMFGGNWLSCWQYHCALGRDDYVHALQSSGFSLVSEQKGEGFARNKLFLIGEMTAD